MGNGSRRGHCGSAYRRDLEAEVSDDSIQAVVALAQEQRALQDEGGHVRDRREGRHDDPARGITGVVLHQHQQKCKRRC